MPIIKNIHRIKEDAYQNNAILALDFGTKRFGLAISDQSGLIATPLANLERSENDQDIAYLTRLIIENNACAVVMGLPKDFNNQTTTTTQQVKSFANLLSQKIEQNIFFWDERYSSKAAEKIAEHKEFRNVKDDKIAATLILQGFLDFKNG